MMSEEALQKIRKVAADACFRWGVPLDARTFAMLDEECRRIRDRTLDDAAQSALVERVRIWCLVRLEVAAQSKEERRTEVAEAIAECIGDLGRSWRRCERLNEKPAAPPTARAYPRLAGKP